MALQLVVLLPGMGTNMDLEWMGRAPRPTFRWKCSDALGSGGGAQITGRLTHGSSRESRC